MVRRRVAALLSASTAIWAVIRSLIEYRTIRLEEVLDRAAVDHVFAGGAVLGDGVQPDPVRSIRREDPLHMVVKDRLPSSAQHQKSVVTYSCTTPEPLTQPVTSGQSDSAPGNFCK